MNFDIPRQAILPVHEAELAVDASPHPYQVAHAEAIERNWQAESAANPALFDGEVMFFSAIRWEDGRLCATCHPVRFATFLQWRLRRSSPLGEHMFAHAMPVTCDGALVAVRMGERTANPGRVYFAAGSFDRSDVIGDRLDISGNMQREVMEETGLDLASCRAENALHAYSIAGSTVLARRYALADDAATVVARIREFIAGEADPEISDAVLIRPGEPLPDGMLAHMKPLIDWHFKTMVR